jgi:hypothetical protein
MVIENGFWLPSGKASLSNGDQNLFGYQRVNDYNFGNQNGVQPKYILVTNGFTTIETF